MKTKNSLLCVTVAVLLLGIIMPVYCFGSHVGFEKRAYAFIDDDYPLFLVDLYVDGNGEECYLLYDSEYDYAFWICFTDVEPVSTTTSTPVDERLCFPEQRVCPEDWRKSHPILSVSTNTNADTTQSMDGRVGGLYAIDPFLQIDKIPGESSDDKHEDWIEVLY